MEAENSNAPQQPSLSQPNMPLKTALKNARQRLGISQEALAKRVGYERTMIARIETGRTRRPPSTFLARCEKALNLVPGTLQQLVKDEDHDARRPRSEEGGGHEYSRVYSSFPYAVVDNLFAAARERIRILQTWVPDIQPLMRGMQEGLRKGAKLEMLVLDPNCAAASLRLEALGISRKNYPLLQLTKLMIDLERLETTCDGTWEVRAHKFPNSIHMYGTEALTILGVYWNVGFSLHGPQIEASTNDSSVGNQAWREFDHLWLSANSVCATDIHLDR